MIPLPPVNAPIALVFVKKRLEPSVMLFVLRSLTFAFVINLLLTYALVENPISITLL